MAYEANYTRPYPNGYENTPSKDTPEMAEFMNARDDALLKIEQFLANLDLSGGGGDYALLTEAGYSLELGIDSNYVMTISLKNKLGTVLSSKNIDFPIESMVVNATYENGKIILTLQNGNSLPIDISDMIRGLVPTTRTIAGIDLEDDITTEELSEALGVKSDSVTTSNLILTNSYAGTLRINEIGGNYEQNGTPTASNPIEPSFSVIRTITTRDDNGNSSTITLSQPITLKSNGDSSDVIVNDNGVFGVKRYFQEKTVTFLQSESRDVLLNSKEIRTATGTISGMSIVKYLCNKAVFVNGTWGIDAVGICSYAGAPVSQLSLRVPANNSSNVDAKIIYRTPSYSFEALPAVDQEALQSLKTYEGTTYIEFDSAITPTINVTYPSSEVLGRLDEIEKNMLSHGDVVDNLLSTATDLPLSANQGKVINESIRWNYVEESSGIYTEINDGYVATENCVLQINVTTGSTLNSGASVFINGTLVLTRRTVVEGHRFFTTDVIRLNKGDVVTCKTANDISGDLELGMYIRPQKRD